jgi:type I restriction enzyme S subunit
MGARRRAVNMVSINQQNVKGLRLPLAPIPLQRKFVQCVRQHNEAAAALGGMHETAEAVEACLLARAFTGELTAEWEAANAEVIAQQQDLYESLPRLAILALLRENARHVAGRTEECSLLITALMKYLFLLQTESSSVRRLYHFVPYKYGPFAEEVYGDLEVLQEAGLVDVKDGLDDRTEICLTDPSAADDVLQDLPDVMLDDVRTVLEDYGDLDHAALLDAVYEKYPAYARKSRRRRSKRH